MEATVDRIIKEPVYDLKQMLKIARSKEYHLSMEEQVQVITVRIRERVRKCMAVVPLASYILESQPATIMKDLEEAEIGMANCQEGIRNYSLPQMTLQRQTSKATSKSSALEKKLQEARKMKKKSAKGQLKCHCC